MSEFLKNKQGVVQVDQRGKPLTLGQPVLIMDSVYCKGGRGSVSTGYVAGFDRHVIVLKGEGAEFEVEHYTQNLRLWQAQKPSNRKPLWQVLRDANLQNVRTDSVSSCYLIGTTKDVVKGWEDGSLFE